MCVIERVKRFVGVPGIKEIFVTDEFQTQTKIQIVKYKIQSMHIVSSYN